MSDNKKKPVCWRREWNGDISDLNSYVHADSEDELDGDGVWEPLYDKAAIDEAMSDNAPGKNARALLPLLQELAEKDEKIGELRAALENLLDVFDRCEKGFPPEVELRFLAKDMAKAALRDDGNHFGTPNEMVCKL